MVVECHHSLRLCGDRMKKKSLPKKKYFFFFRETPTSPWVPFRAKFRLLGRPFRPSRPLAWSLAGTMGKFYLSSRAGIINRNIG